MKSQLIGEISGSMLRFALHEFMAQIEMSKNYRVHISEIVQDKITLQGNDLSVSFDAEDAAENLRKEFARLERIDHQALNVSHDCDLIETPSGVRRIIREDV